MNIFFKLGIFCLTVFFTQHSALPPKDGPAWAGSTQHSALSSKYEAIVEGKITQKKVKKISGYYITEYKLKPSKWIHKKENIEKEKYITIRILGAELPEKGIVIKASSSPDFIPLNKKAIFFLEKPKKKQKNIFTLSKDGIIFKDT